MLLGIAVAVIQTLAPDTAERQTIPSSPTSIPAPRRGPEPTDKAVTAASAPAGRAEKMRLQQATPSRDVPGPVADPDPALMEPNPDAPHTFLPRIASDGRTPMHEYAAGFDPSTRRPRVGILLAGIGMSEADSLAAMHLLPAAVTLAISPYATSTDRLLAAARSAEHEYLLSIPMEPEGFPENDPDDRHALMTSLPPADNLTRLHWAMSRFAGYVGVTSALGQLRGERLSSVPEQLEPMLEDVAARGLLYVDTRPEQPALRPTWNRSVDLVIDDDPVDEATLDGRLEALAKLAKDKGSALGLVTLPRPITLDRVFAWTKRLLDKGLVLAPVSALVLPPVAREPEK